MRTRSSHGGLRRARGALRARSARPPRDPRARRMVAIVCSVLLGLSASAAEAAFTATTGSAPGTFAVPAADTTGPTLSSIAVAREVTSLQLTVQANVYRQNGLYRVYAQATDAGSGVASAIADMAQLGGGAAETLSPTGGPWTVAGQSYNLRSAVLTARDTTTASTYQFDARAYDVAGNASSIVSQNVGPQSYVQARAATAGLKSAWPMDSSGTAAQTYRSDAFGSGTTLPGRALTPTGTWQESFATPGTTSRIISGRVRQDGTGTSVSTTDFSLGSHQVVQADVVVRTVVDGSEAGVVAGLSGTGATASYYAARYVRHPASAAPGAVPGWELTRCLADACTLLDTAPATLGAGSTTTVRLVVHGPVLRLLTGGGAGTVVASALDLAPLTGSRTGVVLGGPNTTDTPGDATGLHLDNFSYNNLKIYTPSAGSSINATYGVPSGAPVVVGSAGSAIVEAPANGSLAFDGVDDDLQTLRPSGSYDYAVKSDFTLETWFKASAGRAGDGPEWWTQTGLLDARSTLGTTAKDFGLAVRSDGRVTGGVGGDGAAYTSTTLDSGPGTSYLDGLWHHVVLTRVQSTGALALYVDGVLKSTGTGTTAVLDSSMNLTFGASAAAWTSDGANLSTHLAGGLDEPALYTTALDAGAVLDHYLAGTGTG